jgi:tripartite-type tricarboxylate transporter receptor subunit TctC
MHSRNFVNRRTFSLGLAAGLIPFASKAQEMNWPSRAISLVVPFPPGGQTDMVGRILADQLTKKFGQQIIVDNRSGVNGSLGSDLVAKAAPDGYTLIVTGAGSHAINQLVNANVKYDSRKDFTHIAMLTRTGAVLVASPTFKGTLKELIAQAKGGKIFNFALTGVGSSGHLCMEMLKQTAGIDFNAVPYRGDAPAITDMLGSQVDLLFVSASSVAQYIQAGKLRALGVTSASRVGLLQDVPTMAEQGLGAVTLDSWTGLAGPRGLSAETVRHLNEVCQTMLASPEVLGRLRQIALAPMPGSSADATKYVASYIDQAAKVVKAGNIKV